MTEETILAFGAHPDDIELGCGGTLIKLVQAGHRIVLVDLTRAELSTRGTVETRAREAARAAGLLGAAARETLELPDGDVRSTPDAKRRVAEVVRRFRPGLVLVPHAEDRHPDHAHAGRLAYEGTFIAGLSRYETGQPAFRPRRLVTYMCWQPFVPSFIVDVSAQFERKMEAIRAYESQFSAVDPAYPETRLTSPAALQLIESRMAELGAQIDVRYGEGFLLQGVLAAESPLDLDIRSF
jgi:N-acetylglucosamine malate deacetylase 1